MFVGTGVTVLSEMAIALAHASIGTDVVMTVMFATIPILLNRHDSSGF
jgi:hypothetical protein